jgi:hypothetical protein
MWHLTLENGMIRLASFFALACLTLAATAFLTPAKSPAEEPSQRGNDQNAEPNRRVPRLFTERAACFHAQFSLN